jgi:glutathione S-transferase
MKLIGSLASPYVRKVRVVLAEKMIDYQLELDDVWSADTRIQQSNPLGKVPCLLMEDGDALFDSRVIVEYLDNVTPLHKLIPSDGRARAEVKCWEALCDGLLDAAILVRLEAGQRPAEKRHEPWVARQMGKVDAALEAMAERLGDKPWASGGKYSLADICMGCALGWLAFRFPDKPWRTQHPNLARHLDKVSERPSFAETVPR